METLSAGQASRPVAGASIATHVLHVAFSLEVFIEWIGGNHEIAPDWAKSWAQTSVSGEEWKELQARLGRQCETLNCAIRKYASGSKEAMWGAAGVLAHTVYHLGTIQVKLDELKKEDFSR